MLLTNANGQTLNLQASKIAAVTPDDDEDFSTPGFLYVGGAGNVAVIAADDTDSVVLHSVAAGTILPIIVKRVLSTGTTASNIRLLL